MSLGSFGRYELLGVLGRGGMGEVFRAHDTATDRVVAIKLLPAHLAEDREYRRRFQREARTAAGLNDPHVVPIHDYGEIEGRLYVDMRLVEGGDLGALIAESGGRLPAERAVAIIAQVAAALDNAHRAGLVHRDVKPSNVLVANHDFVYLIDFGIARAVGDTAMTGTGHMIGTLAYMAPERFNGTTDARSDVYSLTCLLHECLTGQRPFPGDSLEEQLAGHLGAVPPQPSQTCPEIPSALDAVIACGMAKDPDQRYQTATALAAAAHTALENATDSPIPHITASAPTQLAAPYFDELATSSEAPVDGPPQAARIRIARYAVASLTLLLAVYLLFIFFNGKRTEPSLDQQTRVTLTPRSLDGSAPTGEELSQGRGIIRSRVDGLGVSGSKVAVVDGKLVVTVPGNHSDDLRDLGRVGRLNIRPVVNSLPVQPAPAGEALPGPTNAPSTNPIADESKWRQNSSQYVQMISLQFEATRCDKEDILADHDDPKLPLITCSTDHKTAYLLGPSIISGDQIQDATSSLAQGDKGYVVKLQFNNAATNVWEDYTATHIGTQTAFTMDTQVVSAPLIREQIQGGRAQIARDDPPFTATAARQLAGILKYGALPLPFETSNAEAVPPEPAAMPVSSSPPLIVVAPAVSLLLVLICALVYLYRPAIRAHAGARVRLPS